MEQYSEYVQKLRSINAECDKPLYFSDELERFLWGFYCCTYFLGLIALTSSPIGTIFATSYFLITCGCTIPVLIKNIAAVRRSKRACTAMEDLKYSQDPHILN